MKTRGIPALHRGARVLFGLAVLTLALPAASGAQVVQTQAVGGAGLNVDVVRASVSQDVLTVVLQYRNTGRLEVVVRSFGLEEVGFISAAEKKKYFVIRDSSSNWIASPVARNQLGYENGGVAPIKIAAGASALVWFKFPAPGANVHTIDLIIPDILPFERLPISRQ